MLLVMLPVRNHLHHRIIITMSQKRKLLPAALGLLSLASLSVRCRRRPLLTGEKPLALPWSALSISGIARPLKARQRRWRNWGAKSLASMAAAIIRCMPITTIFYCHARWTRVISILGDSAVEPKFKALRDAGIRYLPVDHVSQYSVNQYHFRYYTLGSTIGRYMAA
ncbi:sugar ABC transporter periplasmic sugar-binding protein [Klebsiella pneumoniae]|uniref:Sugar ABC transporter periplasmic sugar-binding protein n=1 Tax=Klebsiella pneumoniae TaxID=573 RepID=A0A4P0XYG6_KLEPN|nr:sugar ABC transporter periplasmic sugar-binding protein [Klebsiella pneumoniae]